MKGTVSLFDKNVLEYIPEDLALLIGCMFQNAEEQLVTFSVFDEIAFAAENLCLSKERDYPPCEQYCISIKFDISLGPLYP